MITLECELISETELAYLVDFDDERYWVPKSQCVFKNGELTMPEWLAIDKGMV